MELYVSVEELKRHLRVDYNDLDRDIEDLSYTAQESVRMRIHRPFEDKECLMDDKSLNPMLKHAIKIMAGTLFANREAVSHGKPCPIPYTLDYLLQPFIKYT